MGKLFNCYLTVHYPPKQWANVTWNSDILKWIYSGCCWRGVRRPRICGLPATMGEWLCGHSLEWTLGKPFTVMARSLQTFTFKYVYFLKSFILYSMYIYLFCTFLMNICQPGGILRERAMGECAHQLLRHYWRAQCTLYIHWTLKITDDFLILHQDYWVGEEGGRGNLCINVWLLHWQLVCWNLLTLQVHHWFSSNRCSGTSFNPDENTWNPPHPHPWKSPWNCGAKAGWGSWSLPHRDFEADRQVTFPPCGWCSGTQARPKLADSFP